MEKVAYTRTLRTSNTSQRLLECCMQCLTRNPSQWIMWLELLKTHMLYHRLTSISRSKVTQPECGVTNTVSWDEVEFGRGRGGNAVTVLLLMCSKWRWCHDPKICVLFIIVLQLTHIHTHIHTYTYTQHSSGDDWRVQNKTKTYFNTCNSMHTWTSCI